MNRRSFNQQSCGLLAMGGFMGGAFSSTALTNSDWRMPDESEVHARTWMAFATSSDIWGRGLLAKVQSNLMLIAKTIAKYEPVTMLVQNRDLGKAQALLGGYAKTAYDVQLLPSPLDDLWIRDTGCTFVVSSGGQPKKAGVNFNFNGWGRKQKHDLDAKVAAFVAGQAGAALIPSPLVLEGGSIEVDGQGTAIISESCVLIANRNAGVTKAQFEAQLKPLLGLSKIIWIPGIKGKDITDGHTDFYARFASPGVVLAGYDSDADSYDHSVTKANIAALKTATDAQGRALKIVTLTAPQEPRGTGDQFAAGYVGFYCCNGAIIAQEFGDADADRAAKLALQRAYPNRVIEQLNVDALASGGGSIHCATQQEPKI